jgi:hypothetical protein
VKQRHRFCTQTCLLHFFATEVKLESHPEFFVGLVFTAQKKGWPFYCLQKRLRSLNTGTYRHELEFDVGLPGCNSVWTCKQIPPFQRSILSPSSRLPQPCPTDENKTFFRNFGIFPQAFTALQPRRSTLASSPP